MEFFEEVALLDEASGRSHGAGAIAVVAQAATVIAFPSPALPPCHDDPPPEATEPAPAHSPGASGSDAAAPAHDADQCESPGPAETAEPSEAAEPAAPPAGPGFTADWRAIVAVRDELIALYAKGTRIAARLFPQANDYTKLGKLADIQDLEPLSREFRSFLLDKACKEFSVPGVPLKVDPSEVWEALGIKAGHFEDDRRFRTHSHEEIEQVLRTEFDPDAIYAYLESRFGGEAGVQRAREQVAEALVKHLDLEHNPPSERGGRLCIGTHAWSEKRFHGGREYSHSTRERLMQAVRALGVVAEWAEMNDLAYRLQFNPPGALRHGEVVSRSKATYPGLELTFYSERVDLLFSPEFGTKFRLFLAKFGPRPERG